MVFIIHCCCPSWYFYQEDEIVFTHYLYGKTFIIFYNKFFSIYNYLFRFFSYSVFNEHLPLAWLRSQKRIFGTKSTPCLCLCLTTAFCFLRNSSSLTLRFAALFDCSARSTKALGRFARLCTFIFSFTSLVGPSGLEPHYKLISRFAREKPLTLS